jgi:uncharacterized protein YcfL
MKKIILLLTSIILFGCSSNEEETAISASSLKVIVTNKGDIINEMSSTEYKFDSEGKVVKEIIRNKFNPQYNSISTFEYDSSGRVIKEFRNNVNVVNVVWDGNEAVLKSGVLNSENSTNTLGYKFLNNRVIESEFMGNIQKFNYDNNDNVISEEYNGEVFVEYLDYDTTILNPMTLIKSIGVLRMYSNPYFKNFYQTKRAYPYDTDDFSIPLTYYNYQKIVNAENKIIKITNDETHYITKFEYN